METLNATLSKNIKKRRKELGLTQAALAQLLGYSEKAVSKWESGKGLPPTAILPKLAKLLQTTPDGLLYATSAQQYYLGIDGGGTKTEFLLANTEGEILRRTVLGTSNPTDIGIAAMQEVLRTGIFEVCGEYPLESISVFAGIAGGTTGENAKKMKEFLSRFGFAAVGCGSDALNAISAGLGEKNGVTVIMGTGSVAFAKQSAEIFRIGGYGYLLGDAGSGFAIGRDAILAALQEEDGSGQKTALYDAVLQKCGGKTVLERLGDFYRGGKSLIAKYAPAVFAAYAAGDAVATRILESHVKEIAKLIMGAAKKINSDTVPVVICGGLTVDHALILPLLKQYLASDAHEYRLAVCDKPIAYGALYLAGMPRKED